MNNILVINAGSSSLKYQLINMDNKNVIAKGIVERIGIEGSVLKHKPTGKENVQIEKPMNDHIEAISEVIAALIDKTHGVVASMEEISAVGHRVVHGGEKFSRSVIIDNSVMDAIRENIELAPLHNPANIMGIEACEKIMPGIPMVAVFDTAFHQTMPKCAYLYGLPMDDYKKYKIRRYGFHGTSHKYVAGRVCELLNKKPEELKIITCHLGNGSSVAAVDGGKSVDTTMGFTPLEGLVMGTRSGDLDPAILPFLMGKKGKTADEIINYLNKDCGVWGISGVSSDFRDLWQAWEEDQNQNAKDALDIFSYRLKKFIGAYAAAMGGVDVITFAGGVGENDWDVRKYACSGLEFLGVKIDEEVNDQERNECVISTPDSRVKVIIVPTDEEMVIAIDTFELTAKSN